MFFAKSKLLVLAEYLCNLKQKTAWKFLISLLNSQIIRNIF